MPEVCCSVCGLPAADLERAGVVASPQAECALAPDADPHVVCSSCTVKLSAEIAEGRTSILQPHTGLKALTEELSVQERQKQPDTMAAKVAAEPTASNAVDFDFARKRHFAGYELLGEISRGSFGVVYKARQPGLDRIVALKVLLDGVHASPEAIERFNREAKSVARLKHPNVVPIYDIGASDGHHYFAMEFIEGYPLSTHILARTLTISDALALAERVADALECAHRAGVIHRDIKPSNILVDKHGVPHITDFGLAKQVDLENKYTMSGTTLGTPAYMPPEQARGQINNIDARSDVYALGTVLYEMLTGVTPFSGRSLLEVVVAVINEPVPPPRQLNPRIHRDVQTIVLKCLEKERDQRYSSIADLRDDLRRFRSGEAILARPASIFSKVGRLVKRHQWFIASAVAVGMALAVSLLILADSRKNDENVRKERESINKKVEELKQKETVKWLHEWEFRGSSGLVPGQTAVYSPEGRLPGAETQVPLDTNSFFGDFRSTLEFILTEDAAQQGFSAGIQSVGTIAGIPFVIEVKGATMKLWAPSDLYVFANNYNKNKDIPLPLEVKIEKESLPLVAGSYVLIIERNGTRLNFSLSGKPSPLEAIEAPITNLFPNLSNPQSRTMVPVAPPAIWGPLGVEIQDYNLSHWSVKYTQLVLRKPPGGLLVQGGEGRRKFGGPSGFEVAALNNFYIGEYPAALRDFKTLAESGDEFNQARAKYQLGLIKEICISTGGDLFQVIQLYNEAKQGLYRLRYPKNSPLYAEHGRLLDEIRMRLALCYARKSEWGSTFDRWRAVDEELTQGWMNNAKVGEALGWELLTILDLAQREPDKDAVIGPALGVFAHCGLDPVSMRLSEDAKSMGLMLSTKGRYGELRELYNAVPTPALFDVFAHAAGRAMPALPEEAFKLLTYLPVEPYTHAVGKKPSALALRAVEVVAALTKLKRYQDAKTLLLRYPTPHAFVQFFDALPVDAVSPENAAVFYTDILPKALAAMPRDEAARVALDRAMDRLGRTLADSGRFDELIALHAGLRGNLKSDVRLAPYFAEAVEKLASSGDPDAEEVTLKLLKYASDHVAKSQAGLRQAASDMARRKAENGDDASYKTILRIKEAYPAARLATAVRKALRDYCQARRYEDAVAYFIQARGKFITDGNLLLPELVAALENMAVEQRERLLDIIWASVRDDLKRLDDDAAVRQWRLEFGDLQLALANWNGARRHYRVLLAFQSADPSVAARAAMRLACLDKARPDPTTDALMPMMTGSSAPLDIQLAAEALTVADPKFAADLPVKVKAIQLPVLNEAEWTLIYGLRAKLDGDDSAAQQFFKQALERAQPGRLWTAAVASELLRPKKVAAEKDLSPIK